MTFEWDEAKNHANIRKHGFDCADAEQMFAGVIITTPDVGHDYAERRCKGIGMIRGRTVAIIFAERGDNIIRIISLRKADHEERQEYEKAIQNGLEAY